MKLKIIIISILALVSIKSYSQDIEYTYDDAGNRTARKIIGAQQAPPPAQANNENKSGSEQDVDLTKPEVFEDLLAEKQIKIYPNPTRGHLKIEMVNYNSELNGSIQIFDMAGRLVQNMANISENMDLDISNQPAGSYIMVIVIGNEKSEWKIIKQ